MDGLMPPDYDFQLLMFLLGISAVVLVCLCLLIRLLAWVGSKL